MTAIDTNSWQGIRAEVMRRIAEGEWRPGDLFETNFALQLPDDLAPGEYRVET